MKLKILILLLFFINISYSITYSDKEIKSKDGIIAIYHNTQPGLGYPTRPSCTGAKISQILIITAAHCVYKYQAENLYISDGVIINDGVGLIPVRDITINPGYINSSNKDDAVYYDLAIIRTGEKMSSKGIIALSNYDLNEIAKKSKMSIFGYGLNENGDYTNKLLAADVYDFSSELLSSKINYVYDVTKLIPVGGYKKEIKKFSGPCQGDSGGPLILNYMKKEFIIGVASYGVVKEDTINGKFICTSDYAASYVRVLPNLQWIKKSARALEKKIKYIHNYKIVDQTGDSAGNLDIKNIYISSNESKLSIITEMVGTNDFIYKINFIILDEKGSKIINKYNNIEQNLINIENKILCKGSERFVKNINYSEFDKKCFPKRFSLIIMIYDEKNKLLDEVYLGKIALSV